jgi:hypothetical protein
VATRAAQPERYEIYAATLRKRLPRFRLPLAGDDRDPVLDLQSAFTRCYDQGNFAAKVDYRRDPATGLNEEDRRWLAELLKRPSPVAAETGAAATGPPSLPHDHVAVAAYYLWQEAGCPQGRDEELWFMAVQQLTGGRTSPGAPEDHLTDESIAG